MQPGDHTPNYTSLTDVTTTVRQLLGFNGRGNGVR